MREGCKPSTILQRYNSSLRGHSLGRRASYNPLVSKVLGVPHIVPAPFSNRPISPLFGSLSILCSARILRSYRT